MVIYFIDFCGVNPICFYDNICFNEGIETNFFEFYLDYPYILINLAVLELVIGLYISY